MRLTTKTDYCLRILIYVQGHPGKSKIQEIADYYGISKNHLSVAVNKLSELGYVISTLGPKGGIEFNESYSSRTIGHLISEIEEIEIAECFNVETNTCRLNPQCRLKWMLLGASKAFLAELNNYKIKDLNK